MNKDGFNLVDKCKKINKRNYLNSISSNKGFTLVELIVVMTILAIMLSFGGFAIIKWQDWATFNQENEYAQTLFVAAQNQLAEYSANGRIETLQKDLKTDDAYGKDNKGLVLLLDSDSKSILNEDGEKYTEDAVWVEAYKKSASERDNYIDDIVAIRADAGQYASYESDAEGLKASDPEAYWVYELLGAYVYDKSILNNAAISIEFTPDDGQVFAVLYSDKNAAFAYLSHEGAKDGAVDIEDRQESYRNEHMIGYYGVSTLTKATRDESQMAKIEISNVMLRNEGSLNLRFDVENGDILQFGYTIDLATGDVPTHNNVADEFVPSMRIEVPSLAVPERDKLTKVTCKVSELVGGVADDDSAKDMPFLMMVRNNPDNGKPQVLLLLDAADIRAGVDLFEDYMDDGADHSEVFRDTYSIFRLGLDVKYIECEVTASGVGYLDSDTMVSNVKHMCMETVDGNEYTLTNARHLYNIRYIETLSDEGNTYKLKNTSDSSIEKDDVYESDDDGDNVINWKAFCMLHSYKSLQASDVDCGWTFGQGDFAGVNLENCPFPSFDELGAGDVFISGYDAQYELSGFSFSAKANKSFNGSNVNQSSGTESAVGLFAANRGTISKITMTAVKVDGKDETGAFVGVNYGSLVSLIVNNVSDSYTIMNDAASDSARLGGIVGLNETSGTIQNCQILSGEIGSKDNKYVGGIAGENKGRIEWADLPNASVKATINGKEYLGGVAGINRSTATISGADIVLGSVGKDSKDDLADYVGGITGENESNANILNCKAQYTDPITGRDYVGGYAGVNRGTIMSDNPVNIKPNVKAYSNYVGGMIGYNDTDAVLRNYNIQKGTVLASEQSCYVGGLIGLNTSIKAIQDDANNPFVINSSPDKVIGGYFVGGVFGGNIINTNGYSKSGEDDSPAMPTYPGKPEGPTGSNGPVFTDEKIHANMNVHSYDLNTYNKCIYFNDPVAANKSNYKIYDWYIDLSYLETIGDFTIQKNGSNDYIFDNNNKIIRPNSEWCKVLDPNKEVHGWSFILYSDDIDTLEAISEYLTNNPIYPVTFTVPQSSTNMKKTNALLAITGPNIVFTSGGVDPVNFTTKFEYTNYPGAWGWTGEPYSGEAKVVITNNSNINYAYDQWSVTITSDEEFRITNGFDNYSVTQIDNKTYLLKPIHNWATLNAHETREFNFHVAFDNLGQIEALGNNANVVVGDGAGNTGNPGTPDVPPTPQPDGPTISVLDAWFANDNSNAELKGEAYVGGYIGYNLLVSSSDPLFVKNTAQRQCLEAVANGNSLIEKYSSLDGIKNNNNSAVKMRINKYGSDNFVNNSLGSIYGKICVGGIVGYCDKDTLLSIYNVNNKSYVYASESISYAYEQDIEGESSHRQADYLGLFVGEDYFRYSYVGGIIGKVNKNTTLYNCKNDSLAVVSGVGTYRGYLAEVSNGTIYNCLTDNFDAGSQEYVGGLVGLNEHGGIIAGCSINGKSLSGKKVVGGFAAENFGYIYDSKVLASSFAATDLGDSVIGSYVGFNGATGCIYLDNNISSINVIGYGEYVGGVVGVNSGDVVDKYRSERKYAEIISSNISGRQTVGGFIGMNLNNENEIMYLKNTSANVSAIDGSLGGIVGVNEGSKISYCMSSALLQTEKGNMGGIVAYNKNGEIDNCTVDSKLVGKGGNSSSGFGGIVGYSAGTEDASLVSNCVFNGSIYGAGYGGNSDLYARVGGIVGLNQKGSTVELCFLGKNASSDVYVGLSENTSNISVGGKNFKYASAENSYAYVGGLVGENYGVVQSANHNTSDCEKSNVYIVGGNGATGGIVGVNRKNGAVNGEFKDNVAGLKEGKRMYDYGYAYYSSKNQVTGNIKAYNDIFKNYDNGILSSGSKWFVSTNSNSNAPVGGIIGLNESDSEITLVDNYANVYGKNAPNIAGGIVGINKNTGSAQSLITYSKNVGQIYSEKYAGGFVGEIEGKGVDISKCYNYGEIAVNNNDGAVGGFIGIAVNPSRDTNISNSDNFGRIKATDNNSGSMYMGGFVGYVASSSNKVYFKNCAQVGIINSGDINKSGYFAGHSDSYVYVDKGQSYNAPTGSAKRFVGNSDKLSCYNSFVTCANIDDTWNSKEVVSKDKNNYYIDDHSFGLNDGNDNQYLVRNSSYTRLATNAYQQNNNYNNSYWIPGVGGASLNTQRSPYYFVAQSDESVYDVKDSKRAYLYYENKSAIETFISSHGFVKPLDTPEIEYSLVKVDDESFKYVFNWNTVEGAVQYEYVYDITYVNPVLDESTGEYILVKSAEATRVADSVNSFEIEDSTNIKSVDFSVKACALDEDGNSTDANKYDSEYASVVANIKNVLVTPSVTFKAIDESGEPTQNKSQAKNFKMFVENYESLDKDCGYEIICELRPITDDGDGNIVVDDSGLIKYVLDTSAVDFDFDDSNSFVTLPDGAGTVDADTNYLISIKAVPLGDSMAAYCESEISYMAPDTIIDLLKTKYSEIENVAFSPVYPFAMMLMADFEEEVSQDELNEPMQYGVYFDALTEEAELADLGGYLVAISKANAEDDSFAKYYYVPAESGRSEYDELDELEYDDIEIMSKDSYSIDEYGVYALLTLDGFDEGDLIDISVRAIARVDAENYLSGDFGDSVNYVIDEKLDVPSALNFEIVTSGKYAGIAAYTDEQKAIYEQSFDKGMSIRYIDQATYDQGCLYDNYYDASIEMAVAIYDMPIEEIYAIKGDVSCHSDDIVDDSYWNIGAYKTIASKFEPIVLGDLHSNNPYNIALTSDYAGMWMKVAFRAASMSMDNSEWSDEDESGISTNYVWVHIPELRLDDETKMVQIDDCEMEYSISVPVLDSDDGATESDEDDETVEEPEGNEDTDPEYEEIDVLVNQQSFDVTIDADVDYYSFDMELFDEESDDENYSVTVNKVDDIWYLGNPDDGLVLSEDYLVIDGFNNTINAELYDGRSSSLQVKAYIKKYHDAETDREIITLVVPDVLTWYAFTDDEQHEGELVIEGRGYSVTDDNKDNASPNADGYFVLKQLEVKSGLSEDNDKHKELVSTGDQIVWKREDNMPCFDIINDEPDSDDDLIEEEEEIIDESEAEEVDETTGDFVEDGEDDAEEDSEVNAEDEQHSDEGIEEVNFDEESGPLPEDPASSEEVIDEAIIPEETNGLDSAPSDPEGDDETEGADVSTDMEADIPKTVSGNEVE